MQIYVAVLALASGTTALVARNNCCFHLAAWGGPGGQVGQLNDGQNRIGQGLPPATYCIDGNGGLTDQSGKGCILTPPTTQWQCDSGASPTGGFSVGCDGGLMYNGNPKFVACPTGDHGGYNIYTTAPHGQGGCVDITLSGDSCQAGCPPANKCPGELSGSFEFPHLIVPVDKSKPDTAEATSYFGEVSTTVSSIFNFDIPWSDAGKTCTLVFMFPTQDQLETSSFTFSGPGGIDFCKLNGVAAHGTTYNNSPKCGTDYGTVSVSPGHSYTLATFACPAGQTISYDMCARDGTCFRYFQDYNPCPIGLYITKS